MEPVLREALLPVLPRLKAAWIFGSVAKQTDTSQSDIDIMLIGEHLLLGDILEYLMPLEAQLGRKINPTVYTPADFDVVEPNQTRSSIASSRNPFCR